MCEIKLYIWHHLNSIWHHTHSLWHHNIVFMTSHPLYSWQHTQSMWHHILYTCEIIVTVFMIRHFLWLWHHTQCIWHLTWCMIDNTTTVSDITLTVSLQSHPLYWWYHTLCKYEITLSAQLQPLPTLVSCVTESWSPWPKLRTLSLGLLWKLETLRSYEAVGYSFWQGQFSSSLPELALWYTHGCTLTLKFNKHWGLWSEEGQIWGI